MTIGLLSAIDHSVQLPNPCWMHLSALYIHVVVGSGGHTGAPTEVLSSVTHHVRSALLAGVSGSIVSCLFDASS